MDPHLASGRRRARPAGPRRFLYFQHRARIHSDHAHRRGRRRGPLQCLPAPGQSSPDRGPGMPQGDHLSLPRLVLWPGRAPAGRSGFRTLQPRRGPASPFPQAGQGRDLGGLGVGQYGPERRAAFHVSRFDRQRPRALSLRTHGPDGGSDGSPGRQLEDGGRQLQRAVPCRFSASAARELRRLRQCGQPALARRAPQRQG